MIDVLADFFKGLLGWIPGLNFEELEEDVQSNTEEDAVAEQHRPLEEVHETKGWYKTQAERFYRINLILASGLVVSVVLNLGMLWQGKEFRYFEIKDDLQYRQLHPIKKPMVTQGQVNNFAVEAITEMLSFSWRNWKEKISNQQDKFTTQAFNKFFGSIRQDGLLDDVVNSELRMYASVTEKGPTVARHGEVDGYYQWIVTFPIKVTWEGMTGTVDAQEYTAEVTVRRVNNLTNHPRGVIIEDVVIHGSIGRGGN